MDSIHKLESELASLPGIGRRSARRLMFHFLSSPEASFQKFIHTLSEAKNKIHPCIECFNYAEDDLCEICSSPRRDKSILCVVERPQDVIAIEDSHSYFGVYHVLGGVISPMEGIGPDHIRAKELMERIEKGNFQEVILALNTTMESEATRLYLKSLLERSVRISELSRGIPAGGELEFVDKGTIQRALLERKS